MTRKAGSGLGVAGSRRSLTTRTQTPMTSSSSTGLVVRDAAVARPSPHSHQAAGCWRRALSGAASRWSSAPQPSCRARERERTSR